MKSFGSILSLVFLIISFLSCKVVSAGDFKSDHNVFSTSIVGKPFAGTDKIKSGFNSKESKSELEGIVSSKSAIINNPSQPTVTFRTEQRHFLDALFRTFFSFFQFNRSYTEDRIDRVYLTGSDRFKLIYPHHYFW